MNQSPTRMIAVALTAVTVLGACGSDDASDSDGPTVDLATAATCLDDAGFVVARESDVDAARVLNDEAKALFGLDESLFLEGHADGKGTGAVSFYRSADDAREADEAGASMRTDDVLAGHIGVVQWDYIATAGGDEGLAEAITGCLG